MFAPTQTRRITRTTRITQKDNENANARPSRITTRNTVKPLSTTGAAAARGGVTAATAASKAKAADSKADPAAGKRKREALGEVTTALNNKGKGKAVAGKGKDVDQPTKEKFDGVVIKTTKAINTTTTIRQGSKPLSSSKRPAAKVVVQPVVLEEVVEVQDEHAMAIDDHTIITRRVSTRSAGTSRRVIAVVEEDEEEASRVTKKPRPSSEAPQSAAQTFEEQLQQVSDAASADFHAINEEEPEADPEGDDWTDLDAEDADDPLMVSEYVVEIFKYMKEIEVCAHSFMLISSANISLSKPQCLTRYTWIPRRSSPGRCVGFLPTVLSASRLLLPLEDRPSARSPNYALCRKSDLSNFGTSSEATTRICAARARPRRSTRLLRLL